MRYWSVLYAISAIFAVGVFAYAPFDVDWWLPTWAATNTPGLKTIQPGDFYSVSRLGEDVDRLFLLILWLTGITFIGVSIAFCYALWKFADSSKNTKATYSHGSRTLEIVWTLIPAGVLVFLGVYQLGTWADLKMKTRAPKVEPIAEVTARQFQWIIRYPGPDNKIRTPDDVYLINDFHFYMREDGQPTLIHLRSEDVLHSFFLPQMRTKQDAVPGLTIPVWFDSRREGRYELACTELCGWGHYKMRGNVTVHANKQQFDEWMAKATAAQGQDKLASAAPTP